MTESEERCIMCERLNKIYYKLYEAIGENGFDVNLDLDEIYSGVLIDFSLNAAGFLSVQNFDYLAESLKESDIKKLLGGTFLLKQLSGDEIESLTDGIQTKTVDKKDHKQTTLYSIQDGKYYIHTKNGKNTLVLKTPPATYNFKHNIKPTPAEFFHKIRNLLAHSVQYKSSSRILLFSNEGYIELSKMWLRGYSEMFVRDAKTFDTKHAKQTMLAELEATGNTLQNIDDINKALSSIKRYFPPEVVSSFFRVNNLVRYRLEYQQEFFKQSLEDKVDTLIQIIDKNPNLLTQTSETINPVIIYNLQQLMSNELSKRGVRAELNEDDDIWQRSDEADKEYADFERKYKFIMAMAEGKKDAKSRALLNNSQKELERIMAKNDAIERDLDIREKLEFAHMSLYDEQKLKYLPVEVAVNVITLMGYNNIISSGFYEDTLAETDFTKLTPAQKSFFERFDLDAVTYTSKGRTFKQPYSPETNCFILTAIRNAISHGFMTYHLPPLKSGQKASFKDAKITFYLDWQDITVTATVDEFYKIFSSGEFEKKRPQSVVTGRVVEVLYQAPEDTEANSDKSGYDFS